MSSPKYDSRSCEPLSAQQTPQPSFIQPLARPQSLHINPIIFCHSSESCNDVTPPPKRRASPSRFIGQSSVSSSDGPFQDPLPAVKVSKHWIRAASSRSIPLSMTHCFQVNGPLRAYGRDRPRRTPRNSIFPKTAKPQKVTKLPGIRGSENSVLSPLSPSPKNVYVPLGVRPNGRPLKRRLERTIATKEKKNALQNEPTKYYRPASTATRVDPAWFERVPTESCSNTLFKNLFEGGAKKSLQAPLDHKCLVQLKGKCRALHEFHDLMDIYPTPLSSPDLLQPVPDEDIFEQVKPTFCPTPSTIEIATPQGECWAIPGDAHDVTLETMLEYGGMDFFRTPFVSQTSEGSSGRALSVDLMEVTAENALTPGVVPVP